MAGPAFTRLDVDERRAQLLDLGTGLFTRFSYDELSMAQIAREAGISKALLYHYFPSKQAYFTATLQDKAAELAALTEPDTVAAAAGADRGQPRRVPALGRGQRRRLREARAQRRGDPRGARGRRRRARRDRRPDPRGDRARARRRPPSCAPRSARWLWFMDGAILDWIEHGDIKRKKLRRLLLGTLVGAITAAGEGALLDRQVGR